MTSAQNAAAFVSRFAQWAERLAARNIVVRQLACSWAGFGSWRVEISHGPAEDAYAAAIGNGEYDTPGPDVFRFAFDGRDQHLTIDSSPVEPLSSPIDWKRILDRNITSEVALPFIDEFLAKRYGA